MNKETVNIYKRLYGEMPSEDYIKYQEGLDKEREEGQAEIKAKSKEWESKGNCVEFMSWCHYEEALNRKETFGEPVPPNHRWMIHNMYFGQPSFNTEEIRQLILDNIGSPDFLAKAYQEDKYFNTISLQKWDAISIHKFPDSVRKAVTDSGCKGVSLSIKNCILKCAARSIANPKEWK
jgi:hypothetical protein